MLTKFALALLLGAATVQATDNDSEYRPYRRSMPSGPTRRFARGGKKAGRDGEEVEVREEKPDYELNLEIAELGEDKDAEEDRRQTGGRYSARLRRGNRGYPGDAEQNSLADWPVDEARLVEDVVTVEALDAEAEANKPVVPEGWYSATAEFSSPLISYSAAPSIKKH